MADLSSVRAIMCDVDGTLVTGNGTADPRTIEAIRRIRDKGILFGLVTGRGIPNIRQHLGPWGLSGLVDAYVASGGVDIVDPGLGCHARCALLSGQTIRDIIGWFEGAPACPMLVVDGTIVISRNDRAALRFSARERIPYRIDSLDPYLEEPQPKLTFVFDPAHMPAIIARAKTVPASCSAIGHPTAPHLFEFMNPAVSKEAGLELLMSWHGWAMDDLMVFGDEQNDIGMIRAAGAGVAMRNGCEAARAAADYVTGSCDENGIGAFLEQHVLA